MLMNMFGREAFDRSIPVMPNQFGISEEGLSRAELVRIMGDHLRYLTGRRGKRATLRAAKLDGMALANVDLSEADLTGASLVGADLSGAILTRAGLDGADLRGCNLRGARLDFADLRGASFRSANLANAVLDGADLRPSRHTERSKASPHNGATDFTNAFLRGASFRHARLDDADFTDAILEGAVFHAAQLGNPCLRGAILTGIDLSELSVPAKALRDALTSPTPAARARADVLFRMLSAHHDWLLSGGERGKPAHLDGEDLRPLAGSLRGLCLAGLSAKNVVAISVDFSGCRLQAAKFDGADLRSASFANADLSGVSFQLAKLAHASFSNARIQDFELSTGKVLPFQAGALPSEARNAA